MCKLHVQAPGHCMSSRPMRTLGSKQLVSLCPPAAGDHYCPGVPGYNGGFGSGNDYCTPQTNTHDCGACPRLVWEFCLGILVAAARCH